MYIFLCLLQMHRRHPTSATVITISPKYPICISAFLYTYCYVVIIKLVVLYSFNVTGPFVIFMYE